MLLQLKTASSPEQSMRLDAGETSYNTTYRSSDVTDYSFKLPSSPTSSPSALDKSIAHARTFQTAHGQLLPHFSESSIGSSPWPSTCVR